MTTWTIDLDAVLKNPDADVEVVVGTVLDALNANPDVLGPAMYVSIPERTFGIRFDLEAIDARCAVDRGMELALDAIASTHADGIELYRGNIEAAEAPSEFEADGALISA